jgi:hypothetical protein
VTVETFIPPPSTEQPPLPTTSNTSKKKQPSKSAGRKRKRKDDTSEDEAESSDAQGNEDDDYTMEHKGEPEEDGEEDQLEDERPTPPSTPKLSKVRDARISDALDDELDGMSTPAMRKKLRTLNEMPLREFDQENIKARLRKVKKDSGVEGAMEELREMMDRGKKKDEKEQGSKKKTVLKVFVELPTSVTAILPKKTRAYNKAHTEKSLVPEYPESDSQDEVSSSSPGIKSAVPPDVSSSSTSTSAGRSTLPAVNTTPTSLPIPANATPELKELRELVLALPSNLEEGKEGDPIASICYSESAWRLELSSGEAWEYWDGKLNTLLQKPTSESQQEYVNKLVKWGITGTVALYRVLAHVMECVVASPILLDGKIQRVIDAIKEK